jgi:hypothetical protein
MLCEGHDKQVEVLVVDSLSPIFIIIVTGIRKELRWPKLTVIMLDATPGYAHVHAGAEY